jgi:putative transposase
MPRELVRYQESGHFHFVTFSCYQRKAYLRTAFGRSLFERSLETMRVRYEFCVAGYVVMPEHVHLLVSEPRRVVLAKALQALKLSVAVQSVQRLFWLTRYYDFNVFSEGKRSEKILYMHQNPVARGLVAEAGGWEWSSYRHYATGERGVVEIESEWTAARRKRAWLETQVSEARPGVPGFVGR